MTRPQGLLVTIDGPGGAGKSTLARLAVDRLIFAGTPVLATTEPSTGPAGELARHHTNVFQGNALACLVAADRYHHLDTQIRPALKAGQVVICDRYVPSSYVFQVLDGVDRVFIDHLNAHTDPPDLAVILTCHPDELQRRLAVRGSHGRFQDDPDISHAETSRYRQVATMLAHDGIRTLLLDSTNHDADFLATRLVTSIQTLKSRTHH